MNDINKDLIQSYILTTAKYDYTAYEKRILYRVIELMQELTEGKKLNQKYSIQTNIFGDMDIQMPVSAFLKDENDQNYSIAKKSLKSLNSKQIQYEDEKVWKLFNLIERPVIDKRGYVTFRLHPVIASVFLDFSKGFRKYELVTAMQFESVYTMRFYELMSGQITPLTYTIEHLKEMFQIQDKYKLVKDLIKRVVIPAKRELDEKSPYSFEYKINKQGKKFYSITFRPTFKPEHRDEFLEQRELQKQISLQWDLPREVINYLKETFLFDTKELKQHIELLKEAYQTIDFLTFVAEKKRYTETAKNPKGYLISCIKSELEKHKAKDTQTQNTTSEKPNKTAQKTENLLDNLAKKKRVK